MLHWPILVKHPDDNQLQLIEDIEQWQDELPLLDTRSVVIIDSQGLSYRWQVQPLTAAGEFHLSAPHSLASIIDWVRLHASQNGHCCTAKLGANNISRVFEILKYLEER